MSGDYYDIATELPSREEYEWITSKGKCLFPSARFELKSVYASLPEFAFASHLTDWTPDKPYEWWLLHLYLFLRGKEKMDMAAHVYRRMLEIGEEAPNDQ